LFQRPFCDRTQMYAPRERRDVRGQVLFARPVRRGLLDGDHARDRHAVGLRRVQPHRPPQRRLSEQARNHTRLGIVSSFRISYLSR